MAGAVTGGEVIGAEIRGLSGLAIGRLGAALTMAAEVTAVRMQASLPERYRDAVEVRVDISADSVHAGVFLTGREAQAWAVGGEEVINVAAYVREESLVFGRPVRPIIEHVSAYQRAVQRPGHIDVDALANDGAATMLAAVAAVMQGLT
ncbi:hypothetical protein [Nitrospirillum viridazoti]|uniref:Uncharacterized protein n=1 Tax=Nitrospirillum viridazoti CBAmc TaxID=1441467 RepID=A0A248JTG9_9PROT|nr:hypothetical protein [Nitrospirillum amazonense]ASG21408.1 hypothetical protein Y958_11640 [Nitrospirillum amazonense CBAmc]TWB33086.1 hypothetical protein FBZ91_115148 [Nitrospirillum amazonense]